MTKRDIIVIGGSAGSLSVLKNIVKNLPSDFPATIFIVWHQAANSPGLLAEILDHLGTLPAYSAKNYEPIKRGRIYVAPPDHHLLIQNDHVRISRGPKENRFRPAIDPLFRSAAQFYGSRVVGVILSGGLDDGSSGLWTIKEYGGTAIIQDPLDADNPSMPQSARQKVKIDYCVAGREIADLLIHLTGENIEEETQPMADQREKTEIETGIAAGDEALRKGVLDLGAPSLFTCPECHGVLLQIAEGHNVRFRCHTGHAYSSGTLLAEMNSSIEDALWNTLRLMDENILLLKHLSRHLKDPDAELAEIYAKEAAKIETRFEKLRELIINAANN